MMTKNAKKGRRDARLKKATLALQVFGETRSTRSVVFWKISEKGASAPLRALARL